MINQTETSSKTVTKFLTSVQRNSVKSKCACETGLHHFQAFLEQKYSKQDSNAEDILKLLSKGELNIYELLILYLKDDHFAFCIIYYN